MDKLKPRKVDRLKSLQISHNPAKEQRRNARLALSHALAQQLLAGNIIKMFSTIDWNDTVDLADTLAVEKRLYQIDFLTKHLKLSQQLGATAKEYKQLSNVSKTQEPELLIGNQMTEEAKSLLADLKHRAELVAPDDK